MKENLWGRSLLILLLSLLGAGALSAGGGVSWFKLPPLQDPRQEVAVAALEGKIYVIGGIQKNLSTADTVEVYDPQIGRWEFASPLPVALHHTAAAAVNGKLYVIGGMSGPLFSSVDSVYEYDPRTDAWSQRAPLPAPRGALAITVLDGKIYAAGGSPSARERDFAVYDPQSDAWRQLPPLPTPRNHLAAAQLGGRFYAIGGRSGGIRGVTGAVEVFDPKIGAWSRAAPMPTARGGIAAAVLGECLYVFGGEGNLKHSKGTFEQVEAYHPASGGWRSLQPMPTPRHGIGAAVVGQVVYIPGGADRQGFGASSVHEALQIEDPALCGS